MAQCSVHSSTEEVDLNSVADKGFLLGHVRGSPNQSLPREGARIDLSGIGTGS
jgi:hypothetical protein